MSSNEDFLSSALIGLIVSITLGLFLKSVNSNAVKENGKLWLEYGVVMKGFSAFTMLLVLGLLVASFSADESEKFAILIIILMFALLGGALVLEFFFVRIGFDNDGVVCNSGWRKTRTFKWDELESARFSQSLQWWEVETATNGKIRLHVYLNGLQDFLVELHQRGIKIT